MNNSPVAPSTDDRTNSRTNMRAAILFVTVAQTSIMFFTANFTTSEIRLGVNHV